MAIVIYLTFLGLNFLLYKVEVTEPTSLGGGVMFYGGKDIISLNYEMESKLLDRLQKLSSNTSFKIQ